MTELPSIEYLAGIFDGEGCIALNKLKPKGYTRPGLQLKIDISMTHQKTVENFKDRWGGSYAEYSRSRGKDYFRWNIHAKLALPFLEEIEPHLRIKNEQALIGIEFQRIRNARLASRKTDEEFEAEWKLYERMKRLNARWGTEYYNE